MRLPSFEEFPDDGGGSGEDGEKVRAYGIGLYEEGQGIPVGKHGYVIDPAHPLRFRGPFYVATAEERGMWDGYRRMVDDELTQPSAPRSKEDLLQLANPTIEDPKLREERQRIIGSEISWVGDYWGKQATIADFRLETEDGREALVFDVSEESVFDRNGTYPREKPAAWMFPTDEIDNCYLDPNLPDRLIFEHRSEQHGRRQYVIDRKNIDPQVLGAQRVARENKERIDGWPQFKVAKQAGDFDPRLIGFLIRDFTNEDLSNLQVEAVSGGGTFTIRGGKEQLGFVAKRMFSILKPDYRGFYPSDATRKLLEGNEQEAHQDTTLGFNEDATNGEEPEYSLVVASRKPRSQRLRQQIEEAIAAALNPDEIEVDTLPRLTVG